MSSISLPGVAVIGGGPAGLMAAEAAIAAGVPVDLFDSRGSVGRKFLIAGKGGLNLTHGEPFPALVRRFREAAPTVETWLRDFDADALRSWARGLGVETFVGSSGRVFPLDLKAAPLLRGWVRRLRDQGVRFHLRRRWLGFAADGALRFADLGADTSDAGHNAGHEASYRAAATVLALGGGSWPQLGSDGRWVAPLREAGIDVGDLLPANCGFDVAWSPWFVQRFAGAPLKPVRIALAVDGQAPDWLQGECVCSTDGIEGSAVYARSAEIREHIAAHGRATLLLDLAPGRSPDQLRTALAAPRGSRTIAEHLRRRVGIDGVKAALLREVLGTALPADPAALAAAVKALPLSLLRPRPLPEAISSAGGIRLQALDRDLMLRARPGVFAAGEMLDWEAPTGGYLLTACFASGRRAGSAAARWREAHSDQP
ncbi:TIGR03862 family flavoprotein [Arenimonas composti]|uniref:NAD(FAD)-utilizing dehydrogenase n=1 Tax=Arenimonas composti TR7-09 = DSM 18010 TaxID=1121013 RepID=A0A091BSS7_9GAMM|nr:TIGR03862 family flavoprotein [Arenimonas composti]KFN47375.1 hypothetical protein P873_01655 [Arenimonas composti TR7-09 = DSM 18010]